MTPGTSADSWEQRDLVPRPDPTLLTNAAIEQVTAQFRANLAALRELIETRLAAMDKATELLAGTVGRVPSDTDKSVGALRELLEARLTAMDKASELLASNIRQFPSELDKAVRALREVLSGEIRGVQDVATQKFEAIEGTFASNALALTAALAAQKEAAAEQNKSNTLAINKSEQATKEASAANVSQTANSLASQAATIADLKDRLVRLESGGVARAEAGTEQREVRGEVRADRAGANQVIIMGVAILSVIVAIVTVIALMLKH